MRAITLSVPAEGLTLSLKARSGVLPAEVVVIVPDDVELTHQLQARSTAKAPPKPKVAAHDARYIVERLRKLKVKTTAAAINSIKAMFQFDEPLTDEAARKRLAEAEQQGLLRINAVGKISFRDA